MTVEEIEIVVTTKVEKALRNFKKLTPELKKQVKQMESTMKNIDLSSIDNAVKTSKRKIASLKKSNLNSEIKLKVNNEDAKKKVEQTKKEIDSIHKTTSQSNKFKKFNSLEEAGKVDENVLKIIDKLPLGEIEKVPEKLKAIEPAIEEVKEKLASVGYVKYNTKSIEDFINQYEQKVEPLKRKEQKEQAKEQLSSNFGDGFYLTSKPSNETAEAANKAKGWANILETVKQKINQIKAGLGQANAKIENSKNSSGKLKNSLGQVSRTIQKTSSQIAKGLKSNFRKIAKICCCIV